jgi:hypothetical protein
MTRNDRSVAAWIWDGLMRIGREPGQLADFLAISRELFEDILRGDRIPSHHLICDIWKFLGPKCPPPPWRGDAWA